MTQAFVWFHNSSDRLPEARNFYQKLLGWQASDGPDGMSMFAGADGPFAGIAPRDGGDAAWIPYAQVEDIDAAAKRAVGLGATVLKPKTRGPAGEFTIVRDPGGATVALWQRA